MAALYLHISIAERLTQSFSNQTVRTDTDA